MPPPAEMAHTYPTHTFNAARSSASPSSSSRIWRTVILSNRVEITLSTHDAGGVSARDVLLARFIDSIGGRKAA